MNRFRVYGDNIIECERFINLIKENTIKKVNLEYFFSSQSVLTAKGKIDNSSIEIELIPGFDKSTKKRWKENILTNIKGKGSSLDETPDIFLTRINDVGKESFVCIIEFCSALQAGNQAWQRSGRAYSTGQTFIPYFYIIEYSKYELDSTTRERKALRDPNPIVPFSYLAYSNKIESPILQTYFQSEEFNPQDDHFKNTDFRKIFSTKTVANYIIALMYNMPTDILEKDLVSKTKNMIKFLSPEKSNNRLTREDIESLDYDDILKSIEDLTRFNAAKKIAKKSSTGNIFELNDLFKKYSKGIFSQDLPFGIIPKDNINNFVNELQKLYKIKDKDIKILRDQKRIVFTLMKGFKPKGDDNRPDRGILPLLRMTFGESCFILTILYGPILKTNYDLLHSDKVLLANRNGLWQTIINMSDCLLIDSDILTHNNVAHKFDIVAFNRHNIKKTYSKPNFDSVNITPVGFREDDVDTLLYMIFKYRCKNTFIGLCNPPGGDWSGFSLNSNGVEYRWLSLPRVSLENNKRPDHIIQFKRDDKDILLIIESKDDARDLEINIGSRLEKYVKWLMAFVPNVKKDSDKWEKATKKIDSKNYLYFTAGSFIIRNSDDLTYLIDKCKVDLLFAFLPVDNKWQLTIYSKKELEEFINSIKDAFNSENIIESVQIIFTN